MVYIKTLNKNIFPHYLPPKEDELFSSWFCRLAINHHVKPQTFIQNYFGRHFPIMNRDIDLNTPKQLFEILEKHIPLSKKNLNKLFLSDYVSYAFEKISEKGGYTNNVLPLGINHRKRKRFGLQFCPSCLKEKIYYRKQWRLATSLICTDCNQYLHDRCFRCSHPIAFHRINISTSISIMDFKPLNICYNCSQNLAEYTPVILPSSNEIKYQIYINSTIKKGYNKISQYSFNYVYTLLFLSTKLRCKKDNRFKEAILNTYPQYKEYCSIDKEIKYWDIKQRRETIPFINELLNNPQTLHNTFINGRVHKSYLDNEKVLPYWIIKLTY